MNQRRKRHAERYLGVIAGEAANTDVQSSIHNAEL
jgi:hypothetical protein